LFAEALADIEKWRGADESPWSLMMLAYVYGRAGQHRHGRGALEKLEQLHQRRPLDPAPMLLAQVGLGNKEAAFAWLEVAYSARSTALPSLKVNAIYDPLRADPRFDGLMRHQQRRLVECEFDDPVHSRLSGTRRLSCTTSSSPLSTTVVTLTTTWLWSRPGFTNCSA
jgi:hypothetical protein